MRLFNPSLVFLSGLFLLTPLYAERSDYTLTPSSLPQQGDTAPTPSLFPEQEDSALASSTLPGQEDDNIAHYLYERGDVDSLPLPPVCKVVLGDAVKASKAAFKWINRTVCEEYQCKTPFKPAFEKYSALIRDIILKRWILTSLKKEGFDIGSMIDVMGKYDKITDKCIKKNPAIINIKDVCKADEKTFSKIKSCVLGEIMDVVAQLPVLLMKAEEGCRAAMRIELVHRVVLPAITDEHATQN